LEASGLTYLHDGSRHGIEDVDLTLRRGSLTVVTGRIGSGKTTLLQVLLGLLPAERGAIWWNGERVDDPLAFFRPPRTAYAGQVPRLFSETLRDNILLGQPDDPARSAIRAAVMEPDVMGLASDWTRQSGRGACALRRQMQRAQRPHVRAQPNAGLDDLSSALDVETEQTRGAAGGRVSPAWPCPTGAGAAPPTTSWCSRMGGLTSGAPWTSCWPSLKRCATSGARTDRWASAVRLDGTT
jgi:ATP-binding cassette subfamily B protein